MRWIGGAAGASQVNSYAFGGTWIIGEQITVVIGSKSWTYTIASTVIATILTGLVTAYNALSASLYPELAEQLSSADATHFLLTAVTPGKPFTAAVTTNSASGTIGGASITTASSGPNDWSTAANWSSGTVPTGADIVILDGSTDDIKYGMAAGGLAYASIAATNSFEGTLGLPKINTDGTPYPEYRQDYLQGSPVLLTVGAAGSGQGAGSGRIKIDLGASACTANVFATGIGKDLDQPALLLKGTSASNVLNIYGQSQVGFAVYGGESGNLSGGLALSGAADVTCGSGVTLGAVSVYGGRLQVQSAIGTSLLVYGGSVTLWGTGAVAQLNLRVPQGNTGLVVYNTSGTLGGNTTVAGNALLDFSQDPRAKTVTNAITLSGSSAGIDDRNKVVGSLSVVCKEDASPAQVNWGANATMARS